MWLELVNEPAKQAEAYLGLPIPIKNQPAKRATERPRALASVARFAGFHDFRLFLRLGFAFA